MPSAVACPGWQENLLVRVNSIAIGWLDHVTDMDGGCRHPHAASILSIDVFRVQS